MGTNTKIEWTHIIPDSKGASWNPFRARNKLSGKLGWFCIPDGAGCTHCYANRMNLTDIGNKLEYKRSNLENVRMELSKSEGQTSIDWPLRAQRSQGIFPVSMSDWLGEFIPTQWAVIMLGTMLLSTQHIFFTLTKRYKNLHNMFRLLHQQSLPVVTVPDDRIYSAAILRARNVQAIADYQDGSVLIENNALKTTLPWPPINIFFGVSMSTQAEAERMAPILKEIKGYHKSVKLWVSQEPAIEIINFEAAGYDKGLLEMIAWGGESGEHARPATFESAISTINYGKKTGTAIFVKQLGDRLAEQLNLDTNDIPDEINVQQFPDITGCYYPLDKKGRIIKDDGKAQTQTSFL